MLGQIQGLLMTMRLWDALDILVVAFFFYRMYILVRDTRATALLKGLVFLGLFTLFAGWLQLHVVSWILDKLMTLSRSLWYSSRNSAVLWNSLAAANFIFLPASWMKRN